MDQATVLRNVIKMQNAGQPPQARVITITSGKGGVGKSNTAVNLAVQLSKRGKKVLIFDADIGLANVEVMFGTSPKYTLSDVIYQGKNVRDIISEGPLDIGFVSGGSGLVEMNNLSREQIRSIVDKMEELDSLADFILVDTGAGISDNVMEFVIASPEVLLIITPEPSSLTDSYSLIKTLQRNPGFNYQKTMINVIANQVNSVADGQAVFDRLNSVVCKFLNWNVNYLGLIPKDPVIERAVRQQRVVSIHDPDAISSKAFAKIAESLLCGENLYYEMQSGFAQMIYNFLNRK